MPRKQPPAPSLRSCLESWLRLLSPTDRSEGFAGRLVTGLRHLLTGSVLLGVAVTVWLVVALLAGGAWQLLQDGRIGTRSSVCSAGLLRRPGGRVTASGGGAQR